MIAGAVVIAVSLFRLIGQQKDTKSTVLFWSVALAGGVILAVVGSARFWHGFEFVPGPVLVTIGDYAVAGVATSVPQEGAELPQQLMYWIGLCVFVPTATWYVVLGLISNRERMLFPLVGLAVASTLFVLTTQYVAPAFETIEQTAVYRFGAIPAISGASLKWLVMAIVFVVVGFFMQTIGSLVNTVSTVGGPPAKSILPAVIGSGVLWLLGHTPLAATMVPMPMLIMIGLAVLASVFLGRTIYGRYLYALGRNEEAARYSGINTDRMVILAYVICSGMAGLGGILFALDINSVQPSGHGNFYELYAIAAAVLGGCSLRGGEGVILGVVIGAAVMRVLYNSINILGIPTQLEFAIIGFVILIAVIIDEVVKRMMATRRAAAQAKEMADTPADEMADAPV
jgi:ribose/xylose/arabinose/galactoside ABC-type transport system permease subunit